MVESCNRCGAAFGPVHQPFSLNGERLCRECFAKAGGIERPKSAPAAGVAVDGGVLRLGGKVFSVANLTSVVVESHQPSKETMGLLMLVVFCFAVAIPGAGLVSALIGLASSQWGMAGTGLLMVLFGLVPWLLFWWLRRVRLKTEWHLVIYCSGDAQRVLLPTQQDCERLKEEIAAAMASSTQSTVIDARQVHVHNPPPPRINH